MNCKPFGRTLDGGIRELLDQLVGQTQNATSPGSSQALECGIRELREAGKIKIALILRQALCGTTREMIEADFVQKKFTLVLGQALCSGIRELREIKET